MRKFKAICRYNDISTTIRKGVRRSCDHWIINFESDPHDHTESKLLKDFFRLLFRLELIYSGSLQKFGGNCKLQLFFIKSKEF